MLIGKLTPIATDLFCLDSTFTVWGCTGSTRMTVISTPAGLVLYSPVALDDAAITDIQAIGEVCTIIAPNLYHHMYLRAAIAAFPAARVLVPDGLAAKIGPIPGSHPITDKADPDLPNGLEHHVFSGHAIRETSLFHRPTGTLITADLLYNYQREGFTAEKVFFGLMGIYGRPGVPFYHRFAIEEKASVSRLIEQVRYWPGRATCK